MDDFSEQLAGSLAAGREDFTGALVEERQAHPRNVPPQYVMQPFSVKLSYNGKSWMTIDLEVGYNEISDTDEPDLVLPEDANAILEGLGFPPLGPIPVMALHHQIDQKLHAVSVPAACGSTVSSIYSCSRSSALGSGSTESSRLRFMTH